MGDQWQERKRPVRLERRYEFSSYSDLRDFLDEAADLSEAKGYYPDMGFGRDYVNITIHLEEGNENITPKQREFASAMDELAANMPAN
jgi:4a-hydroxytetrahydrobiopterin dehydratase